jgi:glycosyltransferase involved in cell wall biosynthesis
MAMLESMALEVPMVATSIGGLAEAILDGKTGLLCSPGDAVALAAKMQALVDKDFDARELGRAASAMVSRHFTLERMVTGNEAVLTAAIAS